METLKFDLNKPCGSFKILNATNGGPWHKRGNLDQLRSNLADYKAARIPYARNHDCCGIGFYGGNFSHDISAIFPRFEADVDDPNSYDFPCTDESIFAWQEGGTEIFFRLGESIEHEIVKHHTRPPKDFEKWAKICEHIIRHYNEGWANGYKLNIQYWEIWNEPDLDPDDSTNKRTWGGTKAQFFDLYEITAKHLKKCFPNIKVGGPALACDEEWADDFLSEMKKRNVALDFFSWHVYANNPEKVTKKAERLKELLIKYGYGNAESILNEWNYIQGWSEEFQYSINMMHGLKGASFVMSVICNSQKCDGIDMLMYYDTRPSVFCGAFDYYSCKPLKGYYPLYWYGMFYDMEHEVRAENSIDNIYSICGVDQNGKSLAVVTYYSNDDGSPDKTISLDFGKSAEYEIYAVDNDKNGELLKVTSDLTFTMPIHSMLLVKEK